MAKNYVSKGFEDKIQINLANICGSENDQFMFVKAVYVIDFTCELCGHQHLSKAYRVKNVNTGKMIDIGSECIKHFKGRGITDSDIDLAASMMKRVEKSIRAGRDMLVQKFGRELFDKLPDSDKPRSYWAQLEKIEELGNEYLKNLPRSEKTPLFVNAYRMHEAELLMDEVARDHHVLSNEEVAEILSLGLESKKEIAIARQEQERKRKATITLRNEVYTQTNAFRRSLTSLPADLVAGWTASARDLGIENEVLRQIEGHESNLVQEREYQARVAEQEKVRKEAEAARLAEYSWITGYTGKNDFLLSLKHQVTYRNLSDIQISKGKEVLEKELNPPAFAPKDELMVMMDALISMYPNTTIYPSIRSQYISKNGFISPKQVWRIRHDYKEMGI